MSNRQTYAKNSSIAGGGDDFFALYIDHHCRHNESDYHQMGTLLLYHSLSQGGLQDLQTSSGTLITVPPPPPSESAPYTPPTTPPSPPLAVLFHFCLLSTAPSSATYLIFLSPPPFVKFLSECNISFGHN